MEDNEDEEEEVIENMQMKVVKEEAIKQNDQVTYKVEKISIEDLDRVLDEYREKDGQVGELHDKYYIIEGNNNDKDG